MTLEVVAAALLGALVLWLLAGPLLGGRAAAVPAAGLDDVVPAEETRRGQALLALKELEFDLATGKIADGDYQSLRERFVAEAVEVMRAEATDPGVDPAEALVAARAAVLARGNGAVTCPVCGPRPEPDATYCSDCGRSLDGALRCQGCSEPLGAGARFCANCGARAPATV